jgi:hypothetical protein
MSRKNHDEQERLYVKIKDEITVSQTMEGLKLGKGQEVGEDDEN